MKEQITKGLGVQTALLLLDNYTLLLSEGSCDSAIASDGKYLYIHNFKGLHKIGSGYGDTIKVFD